MGLKLGLSSIGDIINYLQETPINEDNVTEKLDLLNVCLSITNNIVYDKSKDFDLIGSLKEFGTTNFPKGYIQCGTYLSTKDNPITYYKINATDVNGYFQALPPKLNKKIALYIGVS